MFSPDEEKETTPGADSSCTVTVGTDPTPGTVKDLDFNGFTVDGEGHKVNYFHFFFFCLVNFLLT